MRTLVLGASGMLGHKVFQVFREAGEDVRGVMRRTKDSCTGFPMLQEPGVLDGTGVETADDVLATFEWAQPDVVINCIGLVKPLAKDAAKTITINSLLPHTIARVATLASARLLHISTDCVFSGSEGGYSEESIPDAEDLYGRSKLMGEVTYGGHLTIRTSIIGRELNTSRNLIEWFLATEGTVQGYRRAFFSGLTTKALAEVLLGLAHQPEATGLLHVAGERVNKNDLLCMLQRAYGHNQTRIEPFDNEFIDRSLKAERAVTLGVVVPSLPRMIDDMAGENSMYAAREA